MASNGVTSYITNRNDFKEYCLRRLGKPVIDLNLDEDQINDRIDDALKFYWDYHFDGTDKTYYKYQLTQEDIDNKWIPVPENVIGVVRIFPLGDYIATNNIFNIRYQIALNDLYTLTYQSMVPYYMAFQQLQLLEQLLVGEQPIRYNRNGNRLYIDVNWDKMTAGYFVVAEAYQIVNPDTYNDVWNDRWLQKYATALIKKQWGSNLTKFIGLQLPGGVQFNGEKIYNDATEEIEKLEQTMIMDYSLPVADMIG
jgi:hypothetical protein